MSDNNIRQVSRGQSFETIVCRKLCLLTFMNEHWTHCTCGGVVASSDIDVDYIEHEDLPGSDRLGVSSSCAKNRGEGVNRT